MSMRRYYYAVVTAVIWLALLGFARAEKNHDEEVDVVIIGGGWAGLGALEALVEAGVPKIKLLEARDALGGRSFTLQNVLADGLATELGSAFLYEDTIMEDIARQVGAPYGPKLSVSEEDPWSFLGLYSSSSEPVDREFLLQQEWDSNFVSFSQLRSYQDSQRDIPYQDLVNEYMDKHMLNASSAPFIQAMVEAQISMEFAAPLDRVASREVGLYANQCIFCATTLFTATQGGGFSRILDHFAIPFLDYISLSSKVTKIDYDVDTDYTALASKTGSPQGRVRVTYTNNVDGTVKTIAAKKVLVTTSLGALKAGTIEFNPPLPTWKQNAIDDMGFGLLDKCILYWDSPQDWWPKDRVWLSLMLNTKQEQPTGLWSTFSNDQALAKDGPFVLTAWNSGVAAEWSEQNQSEDDILANVLDNLRLMFGTDAVPNPTKHVIKLWGLDPLAHGSYSYVPVGIDVAASRANLTSTMYDQMYFAGEATSEWSYGTTYGAYETGKREADKMLKGLPVVEPDSDFTSLDEMEELSSSMAAASSSCLSVMVAAFFFAALVVVA